MGILGRLLVKSLFTFLLITYSISVSAHRDSDADTLIECKWNEKYLKDTKLESSCNDLYHLYQPKSLPKMTKDATLKIGSFNMYILAGRNRNKEFPILSRIFNEYDLMAVSEVQHSTTEELKSNKNLAKNASSLSYKDYYHPPGYLRLLEELRKEDPSWSLILSPSAQSESEELKGFFFKSKKVQLKKSEYCEEYNRDLRDLKTLHFAGGIMNKPHGRSVVSPHLNKSFGCTLRIEADENNISRIPFSARFKTASGFDFQYLSYHARYDAPIAVGRTCGFECMELVSDFYTPFHKKGAFLGTLDYTALRLLNGHLKYVSLSSSNSERGLFEGFSALTKLKYGKPRIYDNLIRVRDLFKKELPDILEKVWRENYSDEISRTNRDKVQKYLLSIYSSPDDHKDFKAFIKSEGRVYKSFVEDIFSKDPFTAVEYRLNIWQDPAEIARFHAIRLIVDEMKSVALREKDTDVLLGGDLNLEVDDDNMYYWSFLKDKFDFADVFIDEPTSIGNKGIANSYDHFIFDEEDSMQECSRDDFFVTNFVEEKSWWRGFEDYFVTSMSDIEKVSKRVYNSFKDLEFIGTKGEVIKASEYNVRSGYKDCFDGQTYKDQSLAKVWQKKLECQTLKFYLEDTEPYRVFKDIVSDHMPVGMTCDGTKDRD